ncbi:MAG: 4-alpha-glucanotransferase [Chloroflexota bacterium]|nr:4-alpha-glucanotransferase [Dehalococcoidia bacterium]MDW8254963.1 4-alpha-glucanotransferase [Chloroflexota bacterium]
MQDNHPPYDWRRRRAGIVLHPTSLPGRHGVGDLGPVAEEWIDFLADAGARLWQILPLGPVGTGGSPYAALSAFAGNPLLISLERLADEGLLTAEEVASTPGSPQGPVDYRAAHVAKSAALALAHARFVSGKGDRRSYHEFIVRERGWLEDWALYAALREHFGGRPWTAWDPALRSRQPEALTAWRERLADRVDYHRFVQWVFFTQWHRIRQRANERGIWILGDLPIFVAHDSADVWAQQDLFFLDERGEPTVVAGVPPDFFSKTGQRWGNPLYRWDMLAARGYDWWIARLRAMLALVDLVRIDHFRGFESYWEVPADAPTALNGTWRPGPGKAVFEAMEAALGPLPIIVEDLGLITPEVIALRDALGYPGMKVLQFAFTDVPANPYLPFHYERNAVVYTGTHDNDTTTGWYASATETERDLVRRYLGVPGTDIAWDFIRLALASVAELAIVPLQDLLSLGSEARMNVPGQAEGNWTWRVAPDALRPAIAARFRELCQLYGRLGA